MFFVSRVLIASILVSWLCHVTCGKKHIHSIKDCNQQTVGVVDCRYQGWQSIPYDVFDFPIGKSSIKLGGNPFVCDCRLAWFYREPNFIGKRNTIIKDLYDRVKCGSSPTKNQRRKLSDLRERDVCPRYRWPRRRVCRLDRRRKLLDCENVEKNIPVDIFDTKMEKISLKNFKYNCDCTIVWFLRKIKQGKYRKRLYKPSNIGKCISPKRLKNKKLQDLTEEDVCPQLPRKAVDACKGIPNPCYALYFDRVCKTDKFTFKCEVINRCENNRHMCDLSKSDCVLTPLSYTCKCKPGFKKITFLVCRDIDECKAKNRCDKNAKCTNLPGSYECKCNSGFIGKGKVCFDINECLKKETCSKDAKCVNSPGSFTCTCKSGFTGNGKQCKDMDECSDKSKCSKNADCSNSPGSYKCECKQGYTGNGKICTDINECSTNQHTCHRDAKCINTSPGYQCHCKPGYKSFDDGRRCEDVDECQSKTYCSKQATCENNPGSFQCVCNSGYSGNGKYCDDINECEVSGQCSSRAKCDNTAGSYKCTCHIGFYGNGKKCKDVDECSNEGDVCLLANSKCFNTPGSYQCKCVDGYSRNKTQCSDIDECQSSDQSPHNCDNNAICINFPGGFKCECKEGYERFTETGTCFKEDVDSPFYEHGYVRIAGLAGALVLVLLTIICCCKCCCGRKGKRSDNEVDGSEEPLLYGAEMPFLPMEMSPIPPNISMISTYSEKQDFDDYDNYETVK